jgi:hypothetical protein
VAQVCGIEFRRHGGRRYEELRRRAKARTESGSRRIEAELKLGAPWTMRHGSARESLARGEPVVPKWLDLVLRADR